MMRTYCPERRVFKITDRGEQGYLSLQAKILSPQLTVIERKREPQCSSKRRRIKRRERVVRTRTRIGGENLGIFFNYFRIFYEILKSRSNSARFFFRLMLVLNGKSEILLTCARFFFKLVHVLDAMSKNLSHCTKFFRNSYSASQLVLFVYLLSSEFYPSVNKHR